MARAVLYRIVCLPTGKAYIGVTAQLPRQRWKTHRRHHPGRFLTLISRAIKKYGDKAFSFEVIASIIGDRDAAEREMIAQEGTLVPRGYNIMAGGGGVAVHSEATRNKMRASHLLRWQKRPRNLSVEHRAALSVAATGRILSAQTRQKMSKVRTGQKRGSYGRKPAAGQLRLF